VNFERAIAPLVDQRQNDDGCKAHCHLLFKASIVSPVRDFKSILIVGTTQPNFHRGRQMRLDLTLETRGHPQHSNTEVGMQSQRISEAAGYHGRMAEHASRRRFAALFLPACA
jgi:hypothetical protein